MNDFYVFLCGCICALGIVFLGVMARYIGYVDGVNYAYECLTASQDIDVCIQRLEAKGAGK